MKRVLHQRCWVDKMRNVTEHARKGDREELKQAAQAICQAADRKQARAAFRCLKLRWQSKYQTMVRKLEKDLPDLLSFFNFPKHLWRQLRTDKHYRALLCTSPTAHPSHGLLTCRVSRSHHLLHLPSL